jgi:hypothetical protein
MEMLAAFVIGMVMGGGIAWNIMDTRAARLSAQIIILEAQLEAARETIENLLSRGDEANH